MAKRPSNRDRMQRLALEAELTAKDKAEENAEDGGEEVTGAKTKAKSTKTSKAKTSKAKTKSASPGAAGGRQKLVWRVVDTKSKVIATFAYPRKAEADARAAELTTKSGQEHRVRGVKVPLTD